MRAVRGVRGVRGVAALGALTDAALAGDDDLAALLAEIEALPEVDGSEVDGPGTDGPEAETFPDTAAQ